MIKNIILGIIVIDILGFVWWSVSGQHPVGDVYLGTITAHVLAYIF